MVKAVALFSGGLDSTLSILTMLRQGIEVKAIKFLTHFDCEVSDRVSCSESFHAAHKFGFGVRTCHLSDKFIDILLKPEHGYGKNMNPCIDCRILMLREAKTVMNATGAEFIITGEVVGQRPMSQRRDTFNLIDREAGVKDYVVRPLSAKLLKITVPETEGMIDREKLYGFSGRSRKPQMALAAQFGLTDYPAPAGGCLLTEPNYAHRFRDLLAHNPAPAIRDIRLLKVGRHFRFSPLCKIVVGRNKIENETIESLSVNGDYLIKVDGCGSPITLISGEITDEAINVAASICARYSDAKGFTEVGATVIKGRNALCVRRDGLKEAHHGSCITDYAFRLQVSPASNIMIEALRIEKARNEKISIA